MIKIYKVYYYFLKSMSVASGLEGMITKAIKGALPDMIKDALPNLIKEVIKSDEITSLIRQAIKEAIRKEVKEVEKSSNVDQMNWEDMSSSEDEEVEDEEVEDEEVEDEEVEDEEVEDEEVEDEEVEDEEVEDEVEDEVLSEKKQLPVINKNGFSSKPKKKKTKLSKLTTRQKYLIEEMVKDEAPKATRMCNFNKRCHHGDSCFNGHCNDNLKLNFQVYRFFLNPNMDIEKYLTLNKIKEKELYREAFLYLESLLD